MTLRPWLMLVAGMASQAAGVLVTTTPTFLIPYFTEQRGLSLVEAGLLAAAPSLGLVLSLVAWGAATDRRGERSILVLGLVATAGAAVWAAFATGFGMLGLALVVAGAMSGSSSAASARIVVGWFPRKRRGLVMGIRQMAQPLGVAVGALLIPALIGPSGSVGLAFGTGAGVCVVIAIVSLAVIVDPPRPKLGDEPGVAANPYRGNATLVRIHTVSALLVIPQFTLTTFGLVWLVVDQGWQTSNAGVVIAVAQFLGALGRIGAGVLSDRVGSRMRPLRWVALAAMVLLLLTAGAGVIHWPIAVAVSYILASCASVADNGLAFTAVAELAGHRWSGRALGVQNTGQFLVAAAVPPLVGALIGVVGYAGAFALVALAPAVAVPLTPRAGDGAANNETHRKITRR